MRADQLDKAEALALRIGSAIASSNAQSLNSVSECNGKELWSKVRDIAGAHRTAHAVEFNTTAEELN